MLVFFWLLIEWLCSVCLYLFVGWGDVLIVFVEIVVGGVWLKVFDCEVVCVGLIFGFMFVDVCVCVFEFEIFVYDVYVDFDWFEWFVDGCYCYMLLVVVDLFDGLVFDIVGCIYVFEGE